MSRDDDRPLESILAELLEAEDAGEPVNIDDLVRKHPQYETDLRGFLANRAYLNRVAPPCSEPSHGTSQLAAPPPKVGAPALGRVGDYELLDEIASGGMGIVYRARHCVLGRIVALKMIREGRHASPTQRERFLVEARAVARLDHPNIVPLYDVGEHIGELYFTMKLVEGPSLAERLEDWTERPRAAAQLVSLLARAMHFAHQRGIMHRDLKPANILLEEVAAADDGLIDRPERRAEEQQHDEARAAPIRWRPLITDFGLAKLQDSDSGLTHTGAVLGTPAYMAPEQAAGSPHDVAITADIYSLGAILYALITGRPAFQAATPTETLRRVMEVEPVAPRKLNPRVARDLETICLKCLEKKPAHRYASADALADELEHWQEHRPISARRASTAERTIKWARRRPALAALVGVAAAAVLTVLGGSLWYNARLEAEIVNVKREHDRAEANFTKSEDFRKQAEERELAARRHAYSAQMNLAYQALEAGHLGQVLRTLDAQAPQAGQNDLRSFDWYYLWRRVHGDLRKVLDAGTGPVRGVHFLPNSHQLIYAGGDGAVRFHDLDSGSVKVWQAHESPIRAMAVSPSQDCVATLGDDGVLKAWNLPEGSQRFVRQGRGERFYTSTSMIAFSPDGEKLTVVLGLESAVLLDALSGQRLDGLRTAGHFNAMAYAADGQTLVVATNNRGILLLPRLAADQTPETLGNHKSYILNIDVATDGTTLASSSEDGVVKLWDLRSRKEIASFSEHTGAAFSLAFSPDGRWLASGGADGAVKLRDLRSRAVRQFGHSSTVYSIDFSSDGTLLATGGAEGDVKIWNWNEEPPSDVLSGHNSVVYSLSFSPDGKTLASGSGDKTIRLWDVEAGKQTATLEGHAGWVSSAVFSPDGEILASGNILPGGKKTKADDETGTVRLWNVAAREVMATLPAHQIATWGVAFAPDGNTLATAGYLDNQVKLWDVKTRQARAVLAGNDATNSRIWCVAYSPEETLLASGSAANNDDAETLLIWDSRTGVARHRLKAGWVWSVAFSPDGKLVATGGDGGHVKLWDVQTGAEAAPIQGHTTAVRCVAVSPDGKIVASGSADKTIRLWDAATGDERATLCRHTSSVISLAYSPDGQTLASGDAGGAIRLWRAASDSGMLNQTRASR